MERKMLSPEAAKRDITFGKFTQGKKDQDIEIDNRENDCIQIWGRYRKVEGRDGEEAQLIIIDRKNIDKLIKLLERCQK